jgi:hypothetical protein
MFIVRADSGSSKCIMLQKIPDNSWKHQQKKFVKAVLPEEINKNIISYFFKGTFDFALLNHIFINNIYPWVYDGAKEEEVVTFTFDGEYNQTLLASVCSNLYNEEEQAVDVDLTQSLTDVIENGNIPNVYKKIFQLWENVNNSNELTNEKILN